MNGVHPESGPQVKHHETIGGVTWGRNDGSSLGSDFLYKCVF